MLSPKGISLYPSVNRIKDQYKVSVRIPPDSEKSSLVRIEGDPQGVQQAKRELLELASRMVSPSAGASGGRECSPVSRPCGAARSAGSREGPSRLPSCWIQRSLSQRPCFLGPPQVAGPRLLCWEMLGLCGRVPGLGQTQGSVKPSCRAQGLGWTPLGSYRYPGDSQAQSGSEHSLCFTLPAKVGPHPSSQGNVLLSLGSTARTRTFS